MKICDNCGAVNSNERVFCVDCDEKLGDKLSDKQEAVEKFKLEQKTEKLYNQNDPLYISLYDKITGALCIAFGVALIVCLAFSWIRGVKTDLIWLGLLFSVLGAAESLLPQLMWALEEMRLSFTVSESKLTPSSFYMYGKRFSQAVCCIICAVIIYLFIF